MDHSALVHVACTLIAFVGFAYVMYSYSKLSERRTRFDARVISENSVIIQDNTMVLRELIPHLHEADNARGPIALRPVRKRVLPDGR